MKKTRKAAPQERIDHSVYGLGSIVEADARYTTIAFDEAGTRKFLTGVVKYAPSDTPAPVKPRRKTAAKRKKKAESPGTVPS